MSINCTKSATCLISTIMTKFINILRQIKVILCNQAYPSCYLFGYWESYVTKDNKTQYKQWKTLWNYINNKKTL